MIPHKPPYLTNPLLRLSYSFIAPLYDVVIDRLMRKARQKSILNLPMDSKKSVLVSGVGTGLDFPLLPKLHRYTAIDFNSAMLARATTRGAGLEVNFVLGDSMMLPFADAHFDHVILHLIVAVVPEPKLGLSEASRVLKPGGTLILLDKFLRPQQRAPIRRLFNGITRYCATNMDVVFEEVLCGSTELEVISNEPMLARGWFRGIVLRKSQ
jgi:ubiquinone/menaquinone biosynthesis C-methylase UbiE